MRSVQAHKSVEGRSPRSSKTFFVCFCLFMNVCYLHLKSTLSLLLSSNIVLIAIIWSVTTDFVLTLGGERVTDYSPSLLQLI